MTRVSSATNHQVRVPRVSPAVPQLGVPGHAPPPAHPLVEVALDDGVGVGVDDVVVAGRDGLELVT